MISIHNSNYFPTQVAAESMLSARITYFLITKRIERVGEYHKGVLAAQAQPTVGLSDAGYLSITLVVPCSNDTTFMLLSPDAHHYLASCSFCAKSNS